MEQRLFVFKIGLAACAVCAILLALPVMMASSKAPLLIAGLTVAFVGVAALLMSFAFKLDALGIRALIFIAVSICLFTVEIILLWGIDVHRVQ